MHLKLLALLALLPAAFVLRGAEQANIGSIEGTVIDQRGHTVGGAWVSAGGTGPLGGRIPAARADEKGRFVIRPLEWDAYSVQACKEEDYVPCDPWFYRGETKNVTLTPESPSAMVEIRLGLKGAAITWVARDALTRAPIKAVSLRIFPIQNPRSFVTGYFPPTIFIAASTD